MKDDAQLDTMLKNFYAGETQTLDFTPHDGDVQPSRSWLSTHKVITVAIGIVVVAMVATGFFAAPNRPPSRGSVVDLMGSLEGTNFSQDAGGAVQPDSGSPLDYAVADFAIQLAQQSITPGRNGLVSPLSAELALAMTANGASGQTRAQMLQVLGGGASISDLNQYLSDIIGSSQQTDAAKFQVANSIWYNDSSDVEIKQSFLLANAQWFGAGAFSAPFNSATLQAINDWVSENTDGLIPKILDRLDPRQVMVLLNALIFDAQWAQPYDDDHQSQGVFTDASGHKQTANFMQSLEYSYIDDDMATGFIKTYENNAYAFVALLPNQGVSVSDYLNSLTGAKWNMLLASTQGVPVDASMPAFSSSYAVTLNDALQAMGMTDAFGPAADFSGMTDSIRLNIDLVLQRTHIDVTPKGTQAGAATAVALAGGAAAAQPKTVTLDRPFIYAIIDQSSNLPLFIGVTNSL